MELSFSMPSKSTSNPKPIRPFLEFDGVADNQDGNTNDKEYVTEFDASQSPTDPNTSTNIVIPPLKIFGRTKNNIDSSITESNGTELGLELGSLRVAVQPGSEISYGLNLRQTRQNGEGKQFGDESSCGDYGDPDGNQRLWRLWCCRNLAKKGWIL